MVTCLFTEYKFISTSDISKRWIKDFYFSVDRTEIQRGEIIFPKSHGVSGEKNRIYYLLTFSIFWPVALIIQKFTMWQELISWYGKRFNKCVLFLLLWEEKKTKWNLFEIIATVRKIIHQFLLSFDVWICRSDLWDQRNKRYIPVSPCVEEAGSGLRQ